MCFNKKNWIDFIPHKKDILLEDFEPFEKYFTLTERRNGLKMIRKVANDDVQAVQFRLFDKKGDEIFKLVNCYIEILPIDWNYEKCLETFPPKTKNKQRRITIRSL